MSSYYPCCRHCEHDAGYLHPIPCLTCHPDAVRREMRRADQLDVPEAAAILAILPEPQL